MKKDDFEKKLYNLISIKRKEMLLKYDRILPTNELFLDRWDKAKMLKFGKNSNIYDSSIVMGDVKIGKNVWIGPFVILEGINGKIKIGDHCNISSGVQIMTHDSVKSVLTSGKGSFDKGNVTIGKNTYIGGLSIINKNVNIGKFCVIGANSFVNKNIPDYSIAFGSPVKIVGKVEIKKNKVDFIYFS